MHARTTVHGTSEPAKQRPAAVTAVTLKFGIGLEVGPSQISQRMEDLLPLGLGWILNIWKDPFACNTLDKVVT